MKILITGANGFTGGYLMRLFEKIGWDFVPMTQFPMGLKHEVTVDFCDHRFSEILNSLPHVDAVVHLGTRVGWDGGTSADLFQPNVLATGQLAHWAQKQGAFFVFASAALIAGEKKTHITADCPPGTENPYLYGKWLAEELIRMSGVSFANLRISGIFGKNGPAHLGLNRAINGVLNGVAPVQYGDGLIKRNYIYVKDLCNIIRHCIQNKIEGTHLVGGKKINTLAEMLHTICTILATDLEPEIKPAGSGYDQIVDPSPALPETMSFKEAITDISRQ
ncbi:MAG: NAD(P)-dependent oxidoreductase [bacterium]|nr:NAD(P)-dependent oxidoreductase [bacterium]